MPPLRGHCPLSAQDGYENPIVRNALFQIVSRARYRFVGADSIRPRMCDMAGLRAAISRPYNTSGYR